MAAQPLNGTPTMGVEFANPAVMSNGAGDSDVLSRIHSALELIHNPYSSNQARMDAQGFLEQVKSLDAAPSHGLTLASDKSQAPVVRHYALSLLEHAIKHKQSNETQALALRSWVLQLAQDVSRQDPSYLRSKIAQLWVEVAKRTWAAEWMDMDEMLVQLWQVPDSVVHKELVLSILETLSDEVFAGDDTIVALREGALSKACVEIFTPATVLAEAFPNRQSGPVVRYGTEGWLERVAQLLDQCLVANIQGNEEIRTCTVKALSLLTSLMPWAIPKAVSASRCVVYMCNGLATPHVAVQKVCFILGSSFGHN